jgi:hypothetical protein
MADQVPVCRLSQVITMGVGQGWFPCFDGSYGISGSDLV